MEWRVVLLIMVSVSLSAFAQIALKSGMKSPVIQRALADSASRLNAVLAIGLNGWVIFGLALYVLGAMVWLLVLARLDVSQAYPFVGLGFILTMLLGALLLGEDLSATRIAGTLLVVAGVLLVSRS